MTNFIFKSQGTYKKLCQQLVIIQSELRHNRQDMVMVLHMLNKLVNNQNLQTQVDDFYETSPQTESDDKRDLD